MNTHTGLLMRSAFSLSAAAALAIGVGLSGAIAQDKTTATLRVASVLAEQSAMSVAMVKWGEAVTQRTEGRLQFRYFWTGTLLSGPDSGEGIRDGRADLGLTGGFNLPARLPLSTIGTIPFMTSNVAAMGYAHVNAYNNNPDFHGEFERSNLHIIGFVPGGVNTVFSKKPLTKIEDMAGVKIRTVGLGADAMQAVGASPVTIPANEIFEGLSKGLLDASSGLPLDAGVDFSLQDAAPNIVDTKYGVYTMALYAINRAVYDGFDPETKKIVDEESAAFLDKYYLPEIQAAEEARCKKAKEAGANFIVWDDEQAKLWKEKLGDTAKNHWVDSVKQYGADGAKFLSSFEEDLRKMEEQHPWTNTLTACGSSN
ncbi:MAG TPA: TRAP transporter substrate-binding protein DctP [Rhizobiaceae bacterium]|nr:TRAP transporter substrate-binding protein DctP [Rhizobiaceae bacterium]